MRPAARTGPLAWFLVVLLALTHCSAFSDRILLALVAPSIKASLALTDFQLGLVQGTAFVAIYAVATLVAGPMADRFGRLRMIIASIVVWSFATAACGLTTSLAALFVARMLLGMGQAALSPAALSLIANVLPRPWIGRGISLYTTGSTLGRSVALLGGAALLATLPAATILPGIGALAPWRTLFVIACLPNIVLIAVFAFVPEPGRRDGARTTPQRALLPWLARHWLLYATHTIAAAATIVAIQTITAWTTSFYLRRFGLTLAASGTLFGLVILVAAPAGHLAGGALLDRLRQRLSWQAPGLMIAAGLAAAAPVAAVFCLAPSLPVSIGALAVLTFVLSLTGPAGFASIQFVTPRDMRGRATAAFISCVTLVGFGLGPPALGALTDHVFGEAGIGMALLTVIVAAAATGIVAIAIQVTLLGRSRHQTQV